MTSAHAHCNHHNAAGLTEGKLRLSVLLTGAFVALELVTGLRSRSLALISDAGHNFADVLALVLSWYALQAARRPASASKTYGYHRAGILAALVNSMTLLAIAGFIFTEAYALVRHPVAVASAPMIVVAATAVLLNGGIALSLHGAAAHDVNLRGVFIHMAGDALSAIGVVLAGLVIHFTGWVYADPLVSALIGLFIVYTSWGIVSETVNVLLEGTPRGLDIRVMARAMEEIPGVTDVHDLHVWTIADEMRALSCHLRVTPDNAAEAARVVRAVKQMLANRYSVGHSTIETECGGCEQTDIYCRMDSSGPYCSHDHS